MKVILANDLFTPIGRFEKTPSIHFPSELPDEVRPHLPKTAIIIGDDAVTEPLPAPKREMARLSELAKAGTGVTVLEQLSKKK